MIESLIEIAEAAARDAGSLLLGRFGAVLDVSTKSSMTDMVTDADRASEALIVGAIATARPSDSILGEEAGELRAGGDVRWIVDPLDGTTNFLFGIPHWAVSIACEDRSGPLVGVVFDVMRDELFSSARGRGAMCNGETIAVSRATDLSRALIATGFSYDAGERETAAHLLGSVIGRVRDVRRAGAASLDLAWTACGRFDGYYESHLAPWDAAAGTLLVTEGGGEVSVMPAIGPGGDGVIAAAPGIATELRALVFEGLGKI